MVCSWFTFVSKQKNEYANKLKQFFFIFFVLLIPQNMFYGSWNILFVCAKNMYKFSLKISAFIISWNVLTILYQPCVFTLVNLYLYTTKKTRISQSSHKSCVCVWKCLDSCHCHILFINMLSTRKCHFRVLKCYTKHGRSAHRVYMFHIHQWPHNHNTVQIYYTHVIFRKIKT